jgi:hypothetical protein
MYFSQKDERALFRKLLSRKIFLSTTPNYYHDFSVTTDGVWIGNRIYYTIPNLNYTDCALTVLHISQITIEHTRSSQSVKVFTSRCLVTAPNGGRSPSSGFRSCPRPQLLASHSNSSVQLSSAVI